MSAATTPMEGPLPLLPSSNPVTNLTVLISGSGTNLQALIDATHTELFSSVHITRVISNRRAAYGLARASKADIPVTYHNLVPYKKARPDTPEGVQAAREAYDADLAKMILEDKPRSDLVVCAGWMHILTPAFLTPLDEAGIPVINLHPALPGAFDGAGAIRREYEAAQSGDIDRAGVMIHYVVAEVDRGEAIVTRDVDLPAKDETLEEWETKIHEIEWSIIVEGTALAIEKLWQSRKDVDPDRLTSQGTA
ncbi:MAG: hypothetical protein M1824_005076 [Vezdaea acicularis]|nr:MAG: hypothetical protein M1824_005076 [Vezdaea acicularis]